MSYGPLEFLIGKWVSDYSGENKAPDPDRNEENTKFRQETVFTPIGDVENHEQTLAVLEYKTLAWEEGDDEEPFHQEVGYWIWDADRNIVMKSFIVPRGIAVNAGGTCKANSKEFKMSAVVGDHTFGVSSNPFLDQEFKTLRYDLKITQIDSNTFSYDEDTQIQIKGHKEIFHHTERNLMKRI
ncbi:MAG: heme-binding beta-barrel domain-containing protein [Bdellovibrio sp.]